MSLDNVKQVIVMRKDLNMRKGKMVAQGAHASIAFLTSRLNIDHYPSIPGSPAVADHFRLSHAEAEWIEGRFTKICVYVESEQALHDIKAAADEADVTCHLIQDAGLTEFTEPTYTCLALGPDQASNIDPITGNLPLL